MSETLQKRIYCFDLLKIISILIVFCHHIMMDLYIIHPMHNLKILETIIVRPNMNLGMIACGMFIMISGATLALKGREYEPIDFYKKRLFRVLIPFYIAYIMCFMVRVYNARSLHIFNDIPIWRFIFTIFGMDEYLSANGVRTFTLGVGEWFLGCIIFCYLVYPFLYKVHKRFTIVTFICMTIYYVVINIFYNNFNFVIQSHMNFFCQIYNFYLGMVLINKDVLSKLKKWLLIITIPIIIFFYFNMNYMPVPDNFKTTVVLVALFITFYLLEEYISSFKPLTIFTVFFNKISLEIYLVHHFIIYEVDYLLGYRQINGIHTLMVIVFDLAVIILLAIVDYKLSSYVSNFVYKTHNERK